ncbi:MAG TPA: hypothetical protein VG759_24480 [Candidatus Angelobacter sp.]|nr:hypothetical protein [Candidatus Angelobacter sp.]
MRCALAIILPVCLASLAFALQDQPPSATPEKGLHPVSVAAFKNGLAFVIRTGQVKVTDGEGQIDHVPPATLGTLWISASAPAVLEEVVAFRHKTPKARSVVSLGDLIEANVGKTVTVTYNNKEYTGEVLGWGISPSELKSETADDDEAQGPRANPPARPVLLRINDKVMALNHSSITSVEVAGKPNLTWSPLEEQKSLRFRIKNATGSIPLTMEYLERGLGWSPSYRIELKDKNTAQLTMQAVLVNDAENLEQADVFFVVGFPNFKYSELHSPMALQESLAKLMASMNGTLGRLEGNALANQMNSNAYAFSVSALTSADGSLATGETLEMAGDSEEDLFLYSRPGVTLKTGERALYNVFSSMVSYDEIYDWEVSATSRVDDLGNYQEQVSTTARKSNETVWHSLRLKNNSKFPWTTAPALVVHGTNPISQELLSYTPKSASGYLKLTVASDIHADRDENEVTRVKGATRIAGTTYDAVTVEGTLRVHNYKAAAATLHVVKDVVGEVLSASHAGKSHKTTKEIEAVNPHSTIEWEMPVKAGEEIELKYRYKIFVHS